MARSRCWCFTLNNPDAEAEATIQGIVCRYLVYGREVGEEGTPHLQGYIEYGRAVRLGGCRRDIPRAHFEVRRGTAEEAADYCKKDGDFFESGDLGGRPGRRTDLELVKTRIDAGASEVEISEELFATWVVHHKAFERYRRLKLPKRDWVMNVEVVHGPTGTGKSRYAIGEHPGCFVWGKDEGWNGYTGQEVVVLDDFNGVDDMDLRSLLKLLDRYPLKLRVLYGTVEFCSRTIIITSHHSPEAWAYPPERLPEILRRVVQVRRLG